MKKIFAVTTMMFICLSSSNALMAQNSPNCNEDALRAALGGLLTSATAGDQCKEQAFQSALVQLNTEIAKGTCTQQKFTEIVQSANASIQSCK